MCYKKRSGFSVSKLSAQNMTTSKTRSSAGSDIHELLYEFDSTRPWQYFARGPPIASSVERGKRKLTTSHKLKKIYIAKNRRTIFRRKNAAFRDLTEMLLTCCQSGCLLRRGACETRILIRRQRNMVYQKSYNEQNYLFSKLMEIRVTVRGIRKVTYHIPTLGKVCKTAFRKCYGLSKSKIQVLLKKIDLENPSVEPDLRGHRASRKFLPLVRETVVNFISSYEATESHYRRSRTKAKRYFNSKISMRQMWSEFLAENPNLRTTGLRRRNRGPVLSFSAFRNIYNNELKELLGFRKSRLDTCQTCDNIENRLHEQRKKTGSHRSEEEILRLRNESLSHLIESEARFASLKYDVTFLAKRVQTVT